AARRGILDRRPMFTRIVPGGVIEADGTRTPVDAILWATGFRHELRHLRPLGLTGPLGGIAMDGTAVAADPRIHLVGPRPAASTTGAHGAGRAAVARLARDREAGLGASLDRARVRAWGGGMAAPIALPPLPGGGRPRVLGVVAPPEDREY